MAKVITIQSPRQAFTEAVAALQDVKVDNVVVLISHGGQGDEDEELMYWGHPAKIYQLLALAQAHIVQTQPLMDVEEIECQGE